MTTELVVESTDELSHFPPFSTANHPQPDEVLAGLLTATEIALRHPEPQVQRLAGATRREIHQIQREIKRRLARQRAKVAEQEIQLTIDRIACALRADADAIRSDSRKLRIAFQRQVVVYLCRHTTGASYPAIGAALNRDHSTMIHAHDTIACRAAREPAFRLFIAKLEVEISGQVSATHTMKETGAGATAVAA